MAQLDLTQNPDVVVDIYPYLDTRYMTGAAWIDITNTLPPIETGCTYANGVWTWPPMPEDMVRSVQDAVATNNIFLALTSPTAQQLTDQATALTSQVTRLLLRRIGGR